MKTGNATEGQVSWKKQRDFVDLAQKVEENHWKNWSKTTVKRHERPPLPKLDSLSWAFLAETKEWK
jgi:hypothetical protein